MHPEIKAIRRQLALPFRVPGRPSLLASNRKPHGPGGLFPLQPQDDRAMAGTALGPKSGLAPCSSRKTAAFPRPEIYELAARTIRKAHPWLGSLARKRPAPSADPLWEKRERFMAARIRSALKRFAPRKAVYLGGWQHLTVGGAFPSLRELLGLEQALSRCYSPRSRLSAQH